MAETRTIRTVLELNAQRFTAGAAQASASAKSLAGELGKIGDATGKQRANYDRVANSLLGVGTAAAAGLGLAAKASMDWESAWAGVLKTVDGTPEQLAAVEDGLRGLAQELPASHTEIAAVAEAAGQLGVQTDSVVDFTRTMINLGETTNLSAEEAATSLARFSNVMGTSQDDVDRLGSALVGLGNNFETTEAEIMAMGMRLSGIGSQLGLTEGDVLGLAAAMSSVGIEAEAGGTAMTMGMKKIDAAVREGGDSLAGFAEVAGMSNEEFSKLWSEDSAAGLEAFVHGLADAGAQGESMSAILSELGIKGIRESDTFLRLASNADGFSEALAQGNAEFEQNLALVEEANKRYETTESQLQIARNAIVDAGISLGASVLPVLADVAGAVADVAGWFAALPEPVQRSVTGLGAIVATTGLVAGGLMKVVPAAMDTIRAFKDLRTTSPHVATGLGKVAGFAARAGVAFVGLQAAGMIADQFREAATTSEEMAAGLLNVAQQGNVSKDSLDDLFAATGTGNAEVRDLAHAIEILDAGAIGKAGDFLASGLGVWDTQTEVATQQIGELDRALASLYMSGNAELVGQVLEESGVAVEDLIERFPTLRTELTATATAMGLEADAATLAKIATGELSPVVDEATGAVTGYNTAQGEAEGATDDATGAVQEQVDALDELQDRLEGTANLLLGSRGAMRDFEASIDDATAAAEENGKTLDRSTEAGRANEAALDGIVQSAHSAADAQLELTGSAEEADAVMRRGREAFIETAEAMGMGTEEAEKLADEMGLIPDFVETEVQVKTEQAQEDWNRIWAELWPEGGHPPMVIDTEVDPDGKVPEFTGLLDEIPQETTTTVTAEADIEPAQGELNQLQTAINESGGTVTINGDSVPGNDVLSSLMEIINSSDGTVTIDGQSVPAEEALAAAIRVINQSGGTVTIEGNNAPANRATDSAKRHADGTTGTIDVNADTASAERGINHAARPRRMTITVGYSDPGFRGSGGSSRGFANGGWLNEGLNAGGWVPGPYPGKGIDNVLWPVQAGAAGGRSLAMQPLAGTEYVVNGQSAQQWGPALEAINSGMSPADLAAVAAQSGSAPMDVGAIASAVNAAMSSWQPVVRLGTRDFYGQMEHSKRMMGGKR